MLVSHDAAQYCFHTIGCTYNGCLYKVGENIPPDDGCNTCFCSANGVIGCTKIGCPAQTSRFN